LQVANRIAQCKEPHTTGENSITSFYSNILCAFSWNKKDWLIARMHGVESLKLGENLLFPASVDMIITNQIHKATDNNISKLSGQLRSYIGKLVPWQSTMDNANWDTLSALRQLTASSTARINEGITVCASSHSFSLKFLIENQFCTAEVETFDWLRNPFDAKLIAGAFSTSRRSYFMTSVLTGLWK